METTYTSRFSAQIQNEHDNSVEIIVSLDENPDVSTVTIFGKGPKSTCEHEWTKREAKIIWKGLSVVLNRKPMAE